MHRNALPSSDRRGRCIYAKEIHHEVSVSFVCTVVISNCLLLEFGIQETLELLHFGLCPQHPSYGVGADTYLQGVQRVCFGGDLNSCKVYVVLPIV